MSISNRILHLIEADMYPNLVNHVKRTGKNVRQNLRMRIIFLHNETR